MRNKMRLFYAVLFCFFHSGYLCSLVKASSASDHPQENRQNEGLLRKVGRYDSAELGSAQQIKSGHGAGGGVGGGIGGSVGGGNVGGSVGGGYAGGQQGTGVIPVYAAGAARNHHSNNHNGGNSMRRSYPLITAIIWAVLEVVITNAFSVRN